VKTNSPDVTEKFIAYSRTVQAITPDYNSKLDAYLNAVKSDYLAKATVPNAAAAGVTAVGSASTNLVTSLISLATSMAKNILNGTGTNSDNKKSLAIQDGTAEIVMDAKNENVVSAKILVNDGTTKLITYDRDSNGNLTGIKEINNDITGKEKSVKYLTIKVISFR